MKRYGLTALCMTLVLSMMTTIGNSSAFYAVQAASAEDEQVVVSEDLIVESDQADDEGIPFDIDLGNIVPFEDNNGIPLDLVMGETASSEDAQEIDETEQAEAVSNEAASSSLLYNVCDFGAIPDDNEDDRAAFNEALAKALETNETITVVIPAGNYVVSDGVFVFSDTNIVADARATITSEKTNGAIVYGAHLDESGARCKGIMLGDEHCANHGFGYTKTQNVTIEGGTWACPSVSNPSLTSAFIFQHSKNIVIKNLTCKNASGHMINLSGTDKATITGVTFMNATKSSQTTDYWSEAIHLDYCNEEGEPHIGAPFDDTPAKNITVDGCTFTNVHAGVGNHHARPEGGEISSNITIKNCSFSDIDAFAVSNRSVDGMKVLDNTAVNVGVFAFITDSSNVTIQNNQFDAQGSHAYDSVTGAGNKDRAAIEFRTTEAVSKKYAVINTVTISDNTILNPVFHGIYVRGYDTSNLDSCKSITISNNTVKKSGDNGIFIQSTSDATIEGNTVTSAGGRGIVVRTSKGALVNKNTVTASSDGLYVLGLNDSPCTARVIDNDLNSKNESDLFLSSYAQNCYLSGNTLRNATFRMLSTASYTGTIDLPKLNKATLKKTTYTYTGKQIQPVPTVTDTLGRVLTLDKDYRVVYSHCTNVGDKTAIVRVIGIGGMFSGQEIQAKFSIVPDTSKAITVKLSKSSYVYTGDAKKPDVTVYHGKTKLNDNSYRVSYAKGRINAGTYTVTVKLRWNYTGTETASFTITKALNPMTIKKKALTKTVSRSTSKAKKIAISKCLTVNKAVGTVSYEKVSGSKYINVDSKTGKLTIAKGTPKSTQKVKVKITAAGDKNYKSKSITVTIKVKVK